jgi:hypothetical protein
MDTSRLVMSMRRRSHLAFGNASQTLSTPESSSPPIYLVESGQQLPQIRFDWINDSGVIEEVDTYRIPEEIASLDVDLGR